MTKYLILVAPAYGHVNPTLALAEELVRRGNEVVYYLTDEFRETVEATGATFQRYESMLGGFLNHMQATGKQPGQMRDFSFLIRALPISRIKEARHVIPQVLSRVRSEQADVILYEAMSMWGRIVAQVLNIPTILLSPTYAINEHFRMAPKQAEETMQSFSTEKSFQEIQAELNDLCASYDVAALGLRDFFMPPSKLTLVFLPRAFQPAGETFDERFAFVGPCILPRKSAPAFSIDNPDDRPLLYISLGTAFNNRPDFFKLCFQAFGDQPWHVIMAHGKRVDMGELGEIPANFQLAPYVPQLEVLQHARVFVTHGGMNSTMESLYYGVPMVLVPQMHEQAMTAQRCNELGLGVELDPDHLTADALRAATLQVRNTPSYRESVQAMQQTVRDAGGYQRAADVISDFVQRQ